MKLVFTRHEEFMAPDRRREGMSIEITSGVRSDGTIVARTGRLLIDNGAYAADAAFFPQLAAMHAGGPYKIDNIRIEASLVYTNRQPSGSVRAPTAPTVCWALESHTDELARVIGMDAVEFRRLNAVREGDSGVAAQVYDKIGLVECIDAAVANLGGEPLGPDEAIGVAIGWWPSFPAASGAIVRLDADGSGQIVTGAQECGTGAVMTLRLLAAAELGMEPTNFEIVAQDTAAAPYDMGATGSQTLINNGRAVVDASQKLAARLRDLAANELEADPADIVLTDGVAHVAGAPTRSIAIADLAAIAAQSEQLTEAGSGTPADYPELATSCVGDHGMAAWVAPQFSCHAVRIRLDRDTGVVRVLEVSAAHDSGTILNPLGALGQIEGGVVMGIGQALTEGTRYDASGRQLNTGLLEYKLQTAADAPVIRTCFVESGGFGPGPRGAKGLAEAPNVATAAAISNAVAKLIGRHVRRLPMTAERVWETANGFDGSEVWQ